MQTIVNSVVPPTYLVARKGILINQGVGENADEVFGDV